MRWLDFANLLNDKSETIEKILDRNIFSTIEYYNKRYPDEVEDWDCSEMLPKHTQDAQFESNYRQLCYRCALKDFGKAEIYYEYWDISKIYLWYSVALASDYRPPKKRI